MGVDPPTVGADDLGRFGLGMKTASLSQCRRLTVVTCQYGIVSGAVWDLDVIAERDQWALGLLSDRGVAAVPHTESLVFDRTDGTVVTWEKFDRATAGRGLAREGPEPLGEPEP